MIYVLRQILYRADLSLFIMPSLDYHDYVIKDGKFIGKFEEMYVCCEDPWHQDSVQPWEETALTLLKSRAYQQVLDIGCGKGRFTQRIKEITGARVVAIDTSSTAIRMASESYPEIQFSTARVPPLPFPDTSFDLVVCSGLLWYVLPKMQYLFKEIQRVLTERGQVLIIHHAYQPGEQRYGNEVMETAEDLITQLPFSLVRRMDLNKKVNHDVVLLLEKNPSR